MKTHSSPFLLAALGVLLCSAGARAAEPDTSQWKCAKCPYPAGTQGEVALGVGGVSDASTSFGDMTGLERDGAHLVLGGRVTLRGAGGYYADLAAADLGLDSRSLWARGGREGMYSLSLRYDELPRHFTEGARTPFLGSGGSVLTLPAGFPAGTTTAMPLTTTLQPIEIGFDRSRFDLAGSWVAQKDWTWRVALRRDLRDGTKPSSGSFFSTASLLPSPVDHTTDQLEASASYNGARWQATLAYQYSRFRNGADALTWSNPFLPVNGGSTGQLALAPDNQWHQVSASAAMQVLPMLRVSADVAAGLGTQNAPFLDATLNPALAVALPAASLDGRVLTFNGSIKASATPLAGLRLNASYARDVRNNDTDILSVPQVSTDIFAAAARSTTPLNLTRDRFKLGADYRGWGKVKLAGGLDWDQHERSYHESLRTRETTLWARAGFQALDALALALDLAHAERKPSTFGTAFWYPPENPLLRRLNLAARTRDSVGARIDWTLSEQVGIGLAARANRDDYDETAIGLNERRGGQIGIDLSFAPAEHTRASIFAQGERQRSRQTGSQLFAAPDWRGSTRERFEVFGLGLEHAAIPDKLDIGADASVSRSRSIWTVQTALGEPPLPSDKTALDRAKLYARWRLNDKIALDSQWGYERRNSSDWHLDGVAPDTVANLLALGNAAPRYTVHWLRLAMRYRF